MLRLRLALSLLILTSLSAFGTETIVLKPILQNVDGVPTADLSAIIQDLNRRKCGDLDELAEWVRYAFQNHGYFKVQVADPLMPSAKDVRGKHVIPVNLSVNAGKKYRIRDIGFSGSTVFSATRLRAMFPIRDGDIFDRSKIAIGLQSLLKLCGNSGYLDCSAVPETQIDNASARISLRIDIDQGPLFHAGRLTVAGDESEPGARDKLLNTWKTYKGQVYSHHILERFLHDLHARPAIKPEQVFEVSLDEEKQLANVYIYLTRPIF